jgi:hypothetical protein
VGRGGELREGLERSAEARAPRKVTVHLLRRRRRSLRGREGGGARLGREGRGYRAAGKSEERAPVPAVVDGVLRVLELIHAAGTPPSAVAEGEEEGSGVGTRPSFGIPRYRRISSERAAVADLFPH